MQTMHGFYLQPLCGRCTVAWCNVPAAECALAIARALHVLSLCLWRQQCLQACHVPSTGFLDLEMNNLYLLKNVGPACLSAACIADSADQPTGRTVVDTVHTGPSQQQGKHLPPLPAKLGTAGFRLQSGSSH